MTVTREKTLTGQTVLLCLLAFFGVVIGANLVMVKFALDSLPGTEVASAYRASLAFNDEIAAARRQSERQWQVFASVERSADGHAGLRIEARDDRGAPLTGVTFSGRLARPTDKRADRDIALAERESGIYLGAADDIAPGQWDLVLTAERGGDRLFLSRQRIVLN